MYSNGTREEEGGERRLDRGTGRGSFVGKINWALSLSVYFGIPVTSQLNSSRPAGD